MEFSHFINLFILSAIEDKKKKDNLLCISCNKENISPKSSNIKHVGEARKK